MGFSVSASAAVIFVGLVVVFTTVYPAVDNGFERLTDARQDDADRLLAQQNTAIDVTNVTYDGGSNTLIVTANNTGSTTVSLSDTDLIVDNEYYEGTRTVEGSSATDLWQPGETLTVEVTVSPAPDRVRLVAEHGVADGGAV